MMLLEHITEKNRTLALHLLIWALIWIVSFISMLQSDGAPRAVLTTTNSCFFFALVVYGNINFLLPRLFRKRKYFLYVLSAMVLVVGAGLARGYIGMFLRYTIINVPFVENIEARVFLLSVSFIASVATVFILSFVFRLAMAYFTLKQQTEKIALQRSQFELKLLKAQVQPHFLFNTLNAMYYEAYLEAPRTALLIERLADTIRYFVDQGTDETVTLATEIQFLDNYIALEKIRIRPEPEITFHRSVDEQRKIPPMLLMTFTENIFKHGIDKISGNNTIHLSLVEKDNHLVFETRNSLNKHADPRNTPGSGLQNLRKRLAILYGKDFDLYTAEENNEYFVARLKIPLA
jgi:sensor histidine kinase YesM